MGMIFTSFFRTSSPGHHKASFLDSHFGCDMMTNIINVLIQTYIIISVTDFSGNSILYVCRMYVTVVEIRLYSGPDLTSYDMT